MVNKHKTAIWVWLRFSTRKQTHSWHSPLTASNRDKCPDSLSNIFPWGPCALFYCPQIRLQNEWQVAVYLCGNDLRLHSRLTWEMFNIQLVTNATVRFSNFSQHFRLPLFFCMCWRDWCWRKNKEAGFVRKLNISSVQEHWDVRRTVSLSLTGCSHCHWHQLVCRQDHVKRTLGCFLC